MGRLADLHVACGAPELRRYITMNYASIALSVLAILISAYSVYETRRNNRIGQQPTIVGERNQGPTEYSFVIKNKGNGPAFFERVEYFQNLQPSERKPIRDVVRETLQRKGIEFQSTVTELGQNSVMAAGEAITLAKIEFHPEDAAKFEAIDNAQIDIRITYKGIYGDSLVWASDDRLLNS